MSEGPRAVTSIVKLPEGTFNKVFLVTMGAAHEITARMLDLPASLLSVEAATLAFARDCLNIESSTNEVK